MNVHSHSLHTWWKWIVAILAFILLLFAVRAAAAQDDFGLMTPLDGVIADMHSASGRLSKTLTDKTTRQRQQDAISKLDELIQILEEQRQRQGGGMSPNPNEPLRDSEIVQGPGGSGPLHDANRQGAWGQLPPKKREQILQSMTEGFPPHYQQLLERYYRRLAEERPADDVESGAAAARTPAGTDAKAPGSAGE